MMRKNKLLAHLNPESGLSFIDINLLPVFVYILAAKYFYKYCK